MKPIVVGVDPGTYIGVAVFDLNANLISSFTITDKGKEAVVSEIIKYGNPIVVASDVKPPPESVIQIASYFNARLFYPRSTISDISKTLETSKYKFNSVHERDAIIAVLSFFKEHANKLRWIERILRDKGLSNIEEDVKRYALSGMRVDDAIKALVPTDNEYKKIIEYSKSLPEAPQKVKIDDRRESDRDTIIGLLESNIRLRARLLVVEEELKKLKSESASMIHDKSIKSQLFSNEMKIRRLKRIIKMKNKKIIQLYKAIDSLRKGENKENLVKIPSHNKIENKSGQIIHSESSAREEQVKNNEIYVKTNSSNIETKKEKDLKNENTTLFIENIVNEYRESKYRKKQ